MLRKTRWLRFLGIYAVTGVLSSCGLFDSGIEWRGGPYALMWIDTSENISVCRELESGGCIGRIDSTVFAVGWDGRYLVAKQHPNNEKSQTNFFIVDSKNDASNADPGKAVVGPLTEPEFQQKAIEMKLPKFTKVLNSLE